MQEHLKLRRVGLLNVNDAVSVSILLCKGRVVNVKAAELS